MIKVRTTTFKSMTEFLNTNGYTPSTYDFLNVLDYPNTYPKRFADLNALVSGIYNALLLVPNYSKEELDIYSGKTPVIETGILDQPSIVPFYNRYKQDFVVMYDYLKSVKPYFEKTYGILNNLLKPILDQINARYNEYLRVRQINSNAYDWSLNMKDSAGSDWSITYDGKTYTSGSTSYFMLLFSQTLDNMETTVRSEIAKYNISGQQIKIIIALGDEALRQLKTAISATFDIKPYVPKTTAEAITIGTGKYEYTVKSSVPALPGEESKENSVPVIEGFFSNPIVLPVILVGTGLLIIFLKNKTKVGVRK